MEKSSFVHYKKTVSLVLCICYVLQFFFWTITRHFISQTTDVNWIFNVSFWGMNCLLIFEITFFNEPKNNSVPNFLEFYSFIALSIAHFFLVYYNTLFALIFILFIAIVTFLFRKKSVSKYEHFYENEEFMNMESTVRISLYMLPVVLFTCICIHINSVIPTSKLCLIIEFAYLIFTYSIIATTYLTWYNNILNKTPFKKLLFDVLWLLSCLLIFLILLKLIKQEMLAIILPSVGVLPILYHHKNK